MTEWVQIKMDEKRVLCFFQQYFSHIEIMEGW